MGRVSGKVAIVTGAASGIGLACARVLTANGANVALIDRDAARLGEAVGAVQAADGARVRPLFALPAGPAAAGTCRREIPDTG